MNFWYYQANVKGKGPYMGVMETIMDNFPMSQVNDYFESHYGINPDKISYDLIQQINREDFHKLYARGTGFSKEPVVIKEE